MKKKKYAYNTSFTSITTTTYNNDNDYTQNMIKIRGISEELLGGEEESKRKRI